MVKFIQRTPILLDKWMKQKTISDVGVSDRREMTPYWLEHRDQPRAIASIVENRFVSADRPFFNVYPKIADSLLKTNLSIKPGDISRSLIHDIPAISVHLPVGSDAAKQVGTNWFILSLFIGPAFEKMKKLGLSKLFLTEEPFMCVYSNSDDMASMRLSTSVMDHTFADAEWIDVEGSRNAVPEDGYDKKKVDSLCRLALGILFLAADPEYVKPVLLKADENKTTPLEERIDRAKRRGVYGFTIGEEVERCPHFRRPHFAIRWTGNVGKIPKLVPVKGAVIGKKLMTTVPTGFEEQNILG
jgi:hypothetical protein